MGQRSRSEGEFSGDYLVASDGREYAVFTQPASLPTWFHPACRGSLLATLLLTAVVSRRHSGPPWSVVVMSGRRVVHRSEFSDLAAANAYARGVDDELRRLTPPPGAAG